ncbi:MAG: flippase [Candidatus Staskawiczbacteria bacterium]|nr:flippase [Candidatus Staskawiczbacteria bacterium]
MKGHLITIKDLLLNNKNDKQTIFKNIVWLGLGTMLNKVLSLALIILAARFLGAEEYGKFSFALAFIYLFVVFFDFGLSPVITREFARLKEKKEDFYSIISLKVLLALGTLVLILLCSFLTVPEKDIQRMILILSLFLIANSFWGMFNSFFHAHQKMEYEAIFDTLQVLMIFAFGFFILFNYPSSENLSYAYFLSALITLVLISIFFHFKIFPLKINFNLLVWKKFLTMSWPLALIGIFGVIYGYIDSVMLGYWKMFAEAGWYNAAQRIVMAGLIPMGFVGASFYPALSKFSKESKEKFQKVWDSEVEIMILLALPLVVGGWVLAQKIIYAFYSFEFAPSILALQILILTVGSIFLYRPFYDAMIVLDQQIKTFWVTIAGAVVNVVLNLILIPKYSLYGAAVATVITNFLILVIIVYFTKKFTFIRFPVLRIFFTFLAAGGSSVLMYFVLKQPLIYNANIFLSVILGATVYFAAFFLIKKYILRNFKYENI